MNASQGVSLRCIALLFIIALFASLQASLLALPAHDVTPINNRDYFPATIRLLQGAEKRVTVMMYLAQHYERYPNSHINQILDALAQAHARGVEVQVVLEASDLKGERNRDLREKNTSVGRWLRERGVKVFEDSPRITTHAKVLVVDGKYTIIGSTNWTYAAVEKNNEAAVLIESVEVAVVYERFIKGVKEQRK